MRLSRRHHTHDGTYIRSVDVRDSAQLALALGGFLGQDVALESVTRFDGSTWTHAKTFLRGAFGLHFRHSSSVLGGQLQYRIAGGSNSLRLDACFHISLRSLQNEARDNNTDFGKKLHSPRKCRVEKREARLPPRATGDSWWKARYALFHPTVEKLR